MQEVNRALYRAKQRGHLELDLLLGKFTEDRVAAMSGEQLIETEKLLTEENPDLWLWITEQQPAPAHVQSNTIFQVRRFIHQQTACLASHGIGYLNYHFVLGS